MQTFWFAQRVDNTPIVDEYGYESGETHVAYTKPVECRGNISPAHGSASSRLFGIDLNYERVIVMDNPCTPINEETVLWVDTKPQLDRDGALILDEDELPLTPHDHIVREVARSLNSVAIAIKKVDVRGA